MASERSRFLRGFLVALATTARVVAIAALAPRDVDSARLAGVFILQPVAVGMVGWLWVWAGVFGFGTGLILSWIGGVVSSAVLAPEYAGFVYFVVLELLNLFLIVPAAVIAAWASMFYGPGRTPA